MGEISTQRLLAYALLSPPRGTSMFDAKTEEEQRIPIHPAFRY